MSRTSLKQALHQHSNEFFPIFLREGEYLIRQNELADCLYLVVNGRFSVVLESDVAVDRVVAEISKGETIGEMSLLTGRRRSTSVRATRDSKVLRISKAQFDDILLTNSTILLDLTRRIAERLDSTTRLRSIDSKPKFISVLPCGSDTTLSTVYARNLELALSQRGRVLHLDFDFVSRHLSHVFTHEKDESTWDSHPEVIQWFEKIEEQNDFIVCHVSPTVDWWSKRCLRVADKIYLVANSRASQALNRVEAHLFEDPLGPALLHTELVLLESNNSTFGLGTQSWLSLRRPMRTHHLGLHATTDYARLIRFLLGEAFGVVLGGGGARGLAHLGVLKAMQELEIPIDIIGGTSIGGAMAGLHCLGLSFEEQLFRLKTYSDLYQPYKKYTWPFISVLQSSPVENFYRAIFEDMRIEDSKTSFFSISCNLNTAQKVVHDDGLFRDAIRASTAIPGVFPPSIQKHALLVDGGIMDNLPIEEMKRRGAKTIIAVDVAAQNDLILDDSLTSLPSAMELIKQRFFGRKERVQVPRLMEILIRTLMVNSVARRSESKSAAHLIIRPPTDKVRILDFSEMPKLAQIGYTYSKPILEVFKASL